jgi:hypothetical protein
MKRLIMGYFERQKEHIQDCMQYGSSKFKKKTSGFYSTVARIL